uniref:EGF-like domain-containing protein n=1 Tax=Gongylonema pulchrum TaxID=637853 RepID=A0A183EJR5_9BILA
LCEEIVCINNGTLIKVPNLVPARYACKCPHPEYIHGAHCELVKCLNGGRPMDNGYCKCLDYWYTGQFCQENLLNEAGNESALVLRPDRSVLPSYIIRLDTIPVFNPHVSSNITKPMDPPPSYEQAVTSSSVSQPINDGAAPVHPPEYTPYPPPPPPRFRPPETPRSV